MPENNWVRVTDQDTGHTVSVRESELPHGNYKVLRADAVDPVTGDVLPPEYAAHVPEDFVPYAKRRKADLEVEVADRNAERQPGSDDYIEVGGAGTIADLAAALDADDAAQLNPPHDGQQADSEKENS